LDLVWLAGAAWSLVALFPGHVSMRGALAGVMARREASRLPPHPLDLSIHVLEAMARRAGLPSRVCRDPFAAPAREVAALCAAAKERQQGHLAQLRQRAGQVEVRLRGRRGAAAGKPCEVRRLGPDVVLLVHEALGQQLRRVGGIALEPGDHRHVRVLHCPTSASASALVRGRGRGLLRGQPPPLLTPLLPQYPHGEGRDDTHDAL